MQRRSLQLAGFIVLMLCSTPLRAEQPESLSVSSGVFEVLKWEQGDDPLEGGGELQFAPRRFKFLPDFVPPLAPIVGGVATSSGSLYLYVGGRLDVPLGRGFMASPSFAVGGYHRAEGMNLGGALQFRSSIELSYPVGPGARLGLTLYHLSNAGLNDVNPGSESLALTYRVGL